MGEAARRKALGAANTHDRMKWRKREHLIKQLLRFTVIRPLNALARREGKPTAWVVPPKKDKK